ncbi:MAG: leucine-rich repeat domain-containing protein, partial [Clostridia bacterium]|nr:leucine-rich repeat domain-containing protein [Clostridia bacterium]
GCKKYDSDVFELTGDLLLYAGYVPKQFEITLELDNGGYFTVEPGETTATYLQSFTLPVPESSDGTKAFTGWYTEANGQGTKITDETGESIGVWKEIENRTFVASWTYMFKYNLINNGAAYSVSGTAGTAGVKEIKIPAVYNGKPVTTVEGNAFMGAGSLVTINIPNTIVNVETGTAFLNCNNLLNVNVYDAKAEYPDDALVQSLEDGEYYSEDGVLFYNNQFNGKEIKFFAKKRTGVYKIPDGTETLPTNIFDESLVSEFIVPSSVTSINASAFKLCNNLTKITFIDSPDAEPLTIYERAFNQLRSLLEINLPGRIVNFSRDIFYYCTELSEANIVGSVRNYVSKDGVICSEDGTEALFAPQAFKGNNGVYEVAPGITKIGYNAFWACRYLDKVIIPAYVTYIDDYAFDSKGSSQSISVIEFMGRENSSNLTIGANAFRGLVDLTEVILPENLKFLGVNAFGNNPNLKKVTVNSVGAVNFETAAFDPTNGVETLVIGKDLGLIEINGVFGTNLKTILLDSQNQNYSMDQYGVLFDTNKTKIVYYPAGRVGNYDIPDTVTSIGAYVFQNKALTEVFISKNVVNIATYAFEGCENLSKITFETGRNGADTLTIGTYAFANNAIKSLILPETTVSVGDYAFAYNPLLKVELPASLTSLGTDTSALKVFDGCDDLYSLKVTEGSSKYLTDASGVLYVLNASGNPIGLVFAPRGDRPETDAEGFVSEEVVPATVTKIWNDAFKDNKQITKITFNTTGSLTVGTDAFSGAKELVEAILPSAGLATIPASMFANATSLKKVTIPASVRTISAKAFYKCTALEEVIFEERTDPAQTLVLADAGSSSSSGGGIGGIVIGPVKPGTGSTSSSNEGVFYGCINLKSIDLPEYTTKIGSYAFALSSDAAAPSLGLESIVIPRYVTEIGDNAFAGIVNTSSTLGGAIVAGGSMGATVSSIKSGLSSVTFQTKEDGTYALTKLGKNAFAYTAIESIVIPNTLVEILDGTFQGTKYLTTVDFAGNTVLKYIAPSAFLSSGIVRTADAAAEGKDEFRIPAVALQLIDSNAFAHATNLKKIVFLTDENGKTGLGSGYRVQTGSGLFGPTYSTTYYPFGQYAFGDTGLETFEFPETSYSNGVFGAMQTNLFQNCTDLKEVYISKAVPTITNVFAGCRSIETITIHEENANLTGAMSGEDLSGNRPIIYNRTADGKTNVIRFAYGNLGSTFTIPEGITEIGERAFEGHNELVEVVIHAGVKVIGNYAFNDCANLVKVTFAEDADFTTFGTYMFQNCVSLADIALPDCITDIPAYTFYGCTSLETVGFGENVVSFGNYCFAKSGLKSITIPADMTNFVGTYVFSESAIENVTFAANDKFWAVDGYSFNKCTALETITLPDSVTLIATGAFNGSGLVSIVLPAGDPEEGILIGTNGTDLSTPINNSNTFLNSSSGPDNLYQQVFADSKNLKEVTFTGVVRYLGGRLFMNCSSLDTVKFVQEDGSVKVNVLPETLEYLAVDAFSGTAFKSIQISSLPVIPPAGASWALGRVGKNMFNNCVNLETVVLPYAMNVIPEAWFKGCVNLVNVGHFDENGNVVDYALPEGLTEIRKDAFNGCVSYIADNGTFSFPAGVTVIASGVLAGCESIETVILPAGVTSIGETYKDTTGHMINYSEATTGVTAFVGMTALTELIIPSNLPYKVDENGFVYDDLTLLFGLGGLVTGDIEIPENTLQIASYAFTGNKAITGVKFNNELEVIGIHAFDGCENLTGDIAFPAAFNTLGTYAFANTAITGVTYRADITAMAPSGNSNTMETLTANAVPTYAFANCANLTYVVIEDGVVQIMGNAFDGDTGITVIVIPKSVTTIVSGAFAKWTEEQTICFRAKEGRAPSPSVWNTSSSLLGGTTPGTCKAAIIYNYKAEE